MTARTHDAYIDSSNQAFDCFSPGSYISSRRQSVELAGYMGLPAALSPTSDNEDSAYISLSHSGNPSIPKPLYHSPPLSPVSPIHHHHQSSSRSERAYAHANAAGMPFAALVRRLSYTSSRLPAKYANRQYREQANKRPKTSSGPLLSSPNNQSLGTVMQVETPVKIPIGAADPPIQNGQDRPFKSITRPMTRRRTKSGDAAMASLGKTSAARAKGKGHKRPSYAHRSVSLMDEIWLKSSNIQKRIDNKALKDAGESINAPASPAISTPREPDIIPASALPSHMIGQSRSSNTPMTPDHEIEAQLAKYGYKRMSMPNLPTPSLMGPSKSPAQDPIAPTAVEFTDGEADQLSPVSMGLRTPSPAPMQDAGNITKISSRRSSIDDRRESRAVSPGWPWHRRNSNASLSSLLSPRFGKQVSPSLSTSAAVGLPPSSSSAANEAAAVESDAQMVRSECPDALVPASPPTPPVLTSRFPEAGGLGTSIGANAAGRGRVEANRPGRGTPKRSLSASFIHLGRKVASFGNSQGFDNSRQNSPLSSSTSSSYTKSPLFAKRLDNGSSHTPASKTGGFKGREWPWRSNSSQQAALHSPAANSPLSTASSLQDGKHLSCKVHEVHPANSSAPISPLGLDANESSKVLTGLRDHSPGFAKSPPDVNTAQADSYFGATAGPEASGPALTSPAGRSAHDNNTITGLGEEEEDYLIMRKKSDLLSPDRALVQQSTERSFIVESRPKIYRNARSDDAGLAVRLKQSQITALDKNTQSLSTSAPTSGKQSSFLLMAGMRSPSRQASPSPSRNLTKIPEADEHDLQTRRESWLASLRGRPVAQKRRLSAADIFGIPPSSPGISKHSESQIGEASPEQTDSTTGVTTDPVMVQEKDAPAELDFSKKPIQPTTSLDEPSSSGLYRASSSPGTSQSGTPAFRSRAASQSSLLSASRPVTPSSFSATPTGLTNLRPFAIQPGALTSATTGHISPLQRQPHRHTQSLPSVPQIDPAALHVSGLGAPESSVLDGSHAKFARALSATARQSRPSTASVPALSETKKKGVSKADKEKMRLLMTSSEDFEQAVDDDDDNDDDAEGIPAETEHEGDQLTSPQLHRTPKLSYATSSSAGSLPSTGEPRTDIRARILDLGTPVRGASALQNSDAHFPQDLVFHRSSPSNRTSSSMSNVNGPKNAFDILLSSRGLDHIDGLPASRVASWARRDRSDDSEITVASNTTIDNDRPRDVFEEGRISVW